MIRSDLFFEKVTLDVVLKNRWEEGERRSRETCWEVIIEVQVRDDVGRLAVKIMGKVYSKYILKAEPTGFADSFNFACERKKSNLTVRFWAEYLEGKIC